MAPRSTRLLPLALALAVVSAPPAATGAAAATYFVDYDSELSPGGGLRDVPTKPRPFSNRPVRFPGTSS